MSADAKQTPPLPEGEGVAAVEALAGLRDALMHSFMVLLSNVDHPDVEDCVNVAMRDVEYGLVEHDRAVHAEAWDEGFDDGMDQALFDARGTSTDSDAHTFPRRNPYRAVLAASPVPTQEDR